MEGEGESVVSCDVEGYSSEEEATKVEDQDIEPESAVIEIITAEEVRTFEEAKEQQRLALQTLRASQNAGGDAVAATEAAEEGHTASNADLRLAYLMRQSEIYSHFLVGSGGSAVSATAGSGANVESGATQSSSGKGSSRKRKANVLGKRTRISEEDEDKELLLAAQSKMTWLEHQPSCIKGGKMRPCMTYAL